jgi:hypothetical protein
LNCSGKNYPESKVASGSEMSVVLGNAVVNLEQAWKEYQQAPERFEEIALSRARLASAAERASRLADGACLGNQPQPGHAHAVARG